MGNFPCQKSEHNTSDPAPVPFELAISNPQDPFHSQLAKLRNNFVFLELKSATERATAYGSGFVIGVAKGKIQGQPEGKSKVYILTCFHNVMKQSEGSFAVGHTNDLRKVVGRTLNQKKFQNLVPYTWGRYQTTFEGADIAVLEGEYKLESNCFQDIGIQDTEINKEFIVSMFGFTESLDSLAGAMQKRAEVKRLTSNLQQINYDARTLAGNSGAPILFFDKKTNRLSIIGVHTGWKQQEKSACGIRINKQIKQWVTKIISGKFWKQLDAKELKIIRKADIQPDQAFRTHSMTVRAKQMYSKKIEIIALQDIGITSNTCKYIVETFKDVKELYLRDNKIDNKGLVQLIQNLGQLKRLEAQHNPITYEFINQMQQNKRSPIQNVSSLQDLKLTQLFKGCSQNQSMKFNYLSVLVECFPRLQILQVGFYKQKDKDKQSTEDKDQVDSIDKQEEGKQKNKDKQSTVDQEQMDSIDKQEGQPENKDKQNKEPKQLEVHLRSCYRGMEKAIIEQLNKVGGCKQWILQRKKQLEQRTEQDKRNFESSYPGEIYHMPEQLEQNCADLQFQEEKCKKQQLQVMRKKLKLEMMKNNMDICRINFLKKWKHLSYETILQIQKKQIELQQLQFINKKCRELKITIQDIKEMELNCPYAYKCIS